MGYRVLAIDNERMVLGVYQMMFGEDGIDVSLATSGDEGLKLLRSSENTFDLIILDYDMPDQSGDEVARAIRLFDSKIPIVVVSGFCDKTIADACYAAGADHFVEKGENFDQMFLMIKGFMTNKLGYGEVQSPLALQDESKRDKIKSVLGMVGTSSSLLGVANLVGLFAPSNETVLILGESGTGKECVARAIHKNSPRRTKPFVAVNCGAIPHDIMESELFGHERGAFTGADRKTIGKFQRAQGGTIFLDEIGEMPQRLQVKLLRVLQERIVEPVGGTESIKLDVRVIAATNKDLGVAIKNNEFRQDLFYRINILKIQLDPLRRRPEDIEPLVEYFIEKEIERSEQKKTISPRALKYLQKLYWRGNVREVENVIKKAFTIADKVIDLDSLDEITNSDAPSKFDLMKENGEIITHQEFKERTRQMEEELLLKAMEISNFNKGQAAKLLGWNNISSLNWRLESLGMEEKLSKKDPAFAVPAKRN